MAAPLAYEEWEIAHGGYAARLRPSLRAASRLERLHDGFTALHQRLSEFDTETVAEIIRQSATDPNEARAFLRYLDTLPLATVTQIALAQVHQLVGALTPAGDPDAKPNPSARPMSWPALYAQLFSYGTGWLGWTAEATWNATPSEILRAFAGHMDRLHAIHGSGKADKDEASEPYSEERLAALIESGGTDPAFDRVGFAALKARIASGG